MLWDIIRLDLLFCVLNRQRTLDIYIIRSYIMRMCSGVCVCWTISLLTCIGNSRDSFECACPCIHIQIISRTKIPETFQKKSEIKSVSALFFSFILPVFVWECQSFFPLCPFNPHYLVLCISNAVIPIISVSAFTAVCDVFVQQKRKKERMNSGRDERARAHTQPPQWRISRRNIHLIFHSNAFFVSHTLLGLWLWFSVLHAYYEIGTCFSYYVGFSFATRFKVSLYGL